ncbi:putative 39S ribosomal protein L44, mitochondrial [Apostichopus japonicus]|uniref:Large ribosomal subunit protein mL44 n=1 Tax=Stichopus japonicus TaxID=307972 RepID=A0A2G8JBS1_STIJA|nr:putative 39S ribosomal protein L44, mitochondrial [Apostichopus japonicus]
MVFSSLRHGCRMKPLTSPRVPVSYTCVKHHSKWFRPMLFELNRQIRSILFKYGPEPLMPRSHKENWDYESELFAFGKRIGEDLEDSILRQALRRPIIIIDSAGKGVELLSLSLIMQFSQRSLFVSSYIQAYLSHIYPKLPTDGIRAISDYLSRTELLSHVAKHLGIGDVIQCEDFPVPAEDLKITFLAIIGAIFEQHCIVYAYSLQPLKPKKLCKFGVSQKKSLRNNVYQQPFWCRESRCVVRDFVISHLIGEELYDIWGPEDPMGLLVRLLEEDGRSPPESRLLREASKNTYTPLFMVGVYSNKELLGWGPGESIEVAETEAAAVALKNLLGIPENRPLYRGIQ